MRSYASEEGKWTSVKDIIPPTVRKPRIGSSQPGQWEEYQRHTNVLKRLGFTIEAETSLQSHLEAVTIRSRDHAALSLECGASETYDFLCKLYLAGSSIRV